MTMDAPPGHVQAAVTDELPALRAQLEKSEANRKKLRELVAHYKEHAINTQQLFGQHETLVAEHKAMVKKLAAECASREQAEQALAAATAASGASRVDALSHQLAAVESACSRAEQQAAHVGRDLAQARRDLDAERRFRQDAESQLVALRKRFADTVEAHSTALLRESSAREAAERRAAQAEASLKAANKTTTASAAVAIRPAGQKRTGTAVHPAPCPSGGTAGRTSAATCTNTVASPAVSAATTVALPLRHAADPSSSTHYSHDNIKALQMQLAELRRQLTSVIQERDTAKRNGTRLEAQLRQATAAATKAEVAAAEGERHRSEAGQSQSDARALAAAVAAERDRGNVALAAAGRQTEKQAEARKAAEAQVQDLGLKVQRLETQLAAAQQDVSALQQAARDAARRAPSPPGPSNALVAARQAAPADVVPPRVSVASRNEVDDLRRTMNALYGSLYGELLQMKSTIHHEIVNGSTSAAAHTTTGPSHPSATFPHDHHHGQHRRSATLPSPPPVVSPAALGSLSPPVPRPHQQHLQCRLDDQAPSRGAAVPPAVNGWAAGRTAGGTGGAGRTESPSPKHTSAGRRGSADITAHLGGLLRSCSASRSSDDEPDAMEGRVFRGACRTSSGALASPADDDGSNGSAAGDRAEAGPFTDRADQRWHHDPASHVVRDGGNAHVDGRDAQQADEAGPSRGRQLPHQSSALLAARASGKRDRPSAEISPGPAKRACPQRVEASAQQASPVVRPAQLHAAVLPTPAEVQGMQPAPALPPLVSALLSGSSGGTVGAKRTAHGGAGAELAGPRPKAARGRPPKFQSAVELLSPLTSTTGRRISARGASAVVRKLSTALRLGAVPLAGVVVALESALLACAAPRLDLAQLRDAGDQQQKARGRAVPPPDSPAPGCLVGWSTAVSQQRDTMHWLCRVVIETEAAVTAGATARGASPALTSTSDADMGDEDDGTDDAPLASVAALTAAASPRGAARGGDSDIAPGRSWITPLLLERLHRRTACSHAAAAGVAGCPASVSPRAAAPAHEGGWSQAVAPLTLTQACAAAAAATELCRVHGDVESVRSAVLEQLVCLAEYRVHWRGDHAASAPSAPLMLLAVSLSAWPHVLLPAPALAAEMGLPQAVDHAGVEEEATGSDVPPVDCGRDWDAQLAVDPLGCVMRSVLQLACTGGKDITACRTPSLPTDGTMASKAAARATAAAAAEGQLAVSGLFVRLSADVAGEESDVADAAVARLSRLGSSHWSWQQQQSAVVSVAANLDSTLSSLLGVLLHCCRQCGAHAGGQDDAGRSAAASRHAQEVLEAVVLLCKFLGPDSSYEKAVRPLFAWLQPGSGVSQVRCLGILAHLCCVVLGPWAPTSPAAQRSLLGVAQRLASRLPALQQTAGQQEQLNEQDDSADGQGDGSSSELLAAIITAAVRCLLASAVRLSHDIASSGGSSPGRGGTGRAGDAGGTGEAGALGDVRGASQAQLRIAADDVAEALRAAASSSAASLCLNEEVQSLLHRVLGTSHSR